MYKLKVLKSITITAWLRDSVCLHCFNAFRLSLPSQHQDEYFYDIEKTI